MQKLFTRCLELDRPWDLDVYVGEQQGYRALRKALGMSSDEVVAEVLGASLRGRGGAGFSTGMKWGFLKKARPDLPHYLVINADEGEPGTFKDRLIMEYDPHRLVEGIICSCYALDCHTSYIFVRGELELAIRRLNTAIAQAREAGWLGESVGGSGFALEIYVHPGAGAYICGEETALLECLEGKPGQPRMKPPFPANVGLFGCPTIINNVETIACVPSILNDGAEGFASFGSPKNGGIKLYGLSGHVRRPGMYEARHGIHLRELIFGEDYGQGVREDRALKAVIPGGSSCPILMPDEIDVAMDFDALRAAGSLFGTGGVIVMDEQTCMVRVAANLAHFYHVESCGQCTPCREGAGWMRRLLEKFEHGTAQRSEIDLVLNVCDNIEGHTICPHGDALAMVVRRIVQRFRPEFEAHVAEGGCSFPEW